MARVTNKSSSIIQSGAAAQQFSAPMVFMWTVEMLSVERFAVRMDISETTVWAWIRDHTLKKHRHYFQIKKIIRFPWGPDLVKAIMEDGLLDKIDEETTDNHVIDEDTAALQASGVANRTKDTSYNPTTIPHVSAQHKSSKPFGDLLPIASEDQQPINAVKSPGRKRRSFSGCPINPDLLK